MAAPKNTTTKNVSVSPAVHEALQEFCEATGFRETLAADLALLEWMDRHRRKS